MKKTLQDLTIKDAFMFAAVMSEPDYCRQLLSILLEMNILEVSVIAEKTLIYHPEYHGVRLDVLAKENDTFRRFNVEMQVNMEQHLPKRTRYYHAQIDMDALLAGENYELLPDTFVIFICDYDPLGQGLYKYSLRTCCLETGEQIHDGNLTFWFSTKGNNDHNISKELLNFLKYVETPEKTDLVVASDFVNAVSKKVTSIKQSRDWEAKFMLLKELLSDERKSGFNEGLRQNILKILDFKNREEIPAHIKKLIEEELEKESNPDVLEQWFTYALESESADDFMQKIKK